MINIEELRADIEAGTPGDWRIVEYDSGDGRIPCGTPMIDGPEEYDAAVIHWDGFKQSYWRSAHGDERAIHANARRIARLPQLEREYLAMREALKKAHDTLHECTAVLSANDCEAVAAVMADARKALGEAQ